MSLHELAAHREDLGRTLFYACIVIICRLPGLAWQFMLCCEVCACMLGTIAVRIGCTAILLFLGGGLFAGKLGLPFGSSSACGKLC